jgi:hypothetical protein
MRSRGYDPSFSISHVRHLGYNELHFSLRPIKCHRRSFMMSLTFISTIYELFHHFLSIASSFEQF